jgi:hypothetical protein
MRPLMLRYMLPLCAVYIEEYIINSVCLSPASRNGTDYSGSSAYISIPNTDPRTLVGPVQIAEGLLPILVSYLYV